MSRRPHHLNANELKRYSFLEKNRIYLSPKEQRELEYLKLKAQYGEYRMPPAPNRPVRQPVERMMAPERQQRQAGMPRPSQPSRPQQSRPRPTRTSSRPIPQNVPTKGQSHRPKQLKKSKKPKKSIGKRIKRFVKYTVLILLLLIGVLAYKFIKGVNTGTQDIQHEQEYFAGEDTKDGVNILLIGTDGRPGQSASETRTDSIMVINVNNKSGKVKMVSFMRDTLIDIEGTKHKLNSVYTFGAIEAENGNTKMSGAENLRQVLKENFDIKIKYYALVNFQTFAAGIDTLFPEGVEIDARFATVEGNTVDAVDVPDDLNAANGICPTQTIKVGPQSMDGRTLLNYARFRHDDDNDFGRVKRQQQVLSAIAQQVKNPTKLFTGAEALGKMYGMMSTNMSFGFLLTNGVGVIGSASNGIESLTIPEDGSYSEGLADDGGVGLDINFVSAINKLRGLGMVD